MTSTTGRWQAGNQITLVLRAANTTNPMATFNSGEAATNQPQLLVTAWRQRRGEWQGRRGSGAGIVAQPRQSGC